ncbi:Cloroperoxidase [Marasmius fiardii PR-910]|nr:Cloroperoxidase [Marasmius fiardii PR-910]
METDHPFIPSQTPNDSRSPCPALNALANHGYLPRSGKDIELRALLVALMTVYNVSYPLALLLGGTAILRYGKLDTTSSVLPWKWRITLDLASLSTFGSLRIAHTASLVHPNVPSHSPEATLLRDVVSHAHKDLNESEPGLTIHDLAAIRVDRESKLNQPLDSIHEQIALGESALCYLALRSHDGSSHTVPVSRINQWFGEERLPDNWWQQVRPTTTIGLMEARRTADEIKDIMAVLRSSRPGPL